jgi:hypothetical protein
MILGIASILFFIYLVEPDNPDSREYLSFVFLIAILAGFLIIIWVFIYIIFIYKRDKVYIDEHDRKIEKNSPTDGSNH